MRLGYLHTIGHLNNGFAIILYFKEETLDNGKHERGVNRKVLLMLVIKILKKYFAPTKVVRFHLCISLMYVRAAAQPGCWVLKNEHVP